MLFRSLAIYHFSQPSCSLAAFRGHSVDDGKLIARRERWHRKSDAGSQRNTLRRPHMNRSDKANLATNSIFLAAALYWIPHWGESSMKTILQTELENSIRYPVNTSSLLTPDLIRSMWFTGPQLLTRMQACPFKGTQASYKAWSALLRKAG